MGVCISCKNETKKYKCPKCDEYYCSIICYKTHSKDEINCTPKKITETIVEDTNMSKTVIFQSEDTVDTDKLEELRNSKQLKSIIENPHLRKLLKEVDSANDAYKAMRVAMLEPLFTEFADECLKIVEPSVND